MPDEKDTIDYSHAPLWLNSTEALICAQIETIHAIVALLTLRPRAVFWHAAYAGTCLLGALSLKARGR